MSAPETVKIRVAIVDDSSFVRAALQRIIAADPRFEVVGQASDGATAIALVARVRPDVATMDFNMPGMAGDEVVRRILAIAPIAIVMVSAHTSEGAAATIAALAAGAIDFVAKPSGEVSMDLARISHELVEKLAQAARTTPRASTKAFNTGVAHADSSPGEAPRSSTRDSASAKLADRIVIIGASTGGPAALDALLRLLPLSSYGVVIVQHMATRALTTALSARLDSVSRLSVREAVDSDRLCAGLALVAPGGRHLAFVAGGAVRLNDDAPMHGVRPAVDLAMKSAASCFGARAIGVVLTGMGRDGALGLASIKSTGGKTIAQDQATSVVFGMPRAAIELGVVDEVAPLEGIAKAIARALAR